MSHFAKVENGIVTEVLVIEQNIVDTGLFGDPSLWIQTSYNTHGNIHYGSNRETDGGIALRSNYAGIGNIYDKENDVFYAQQPFPSWTLNTSTWLWEAPVAYPSDNKYYIWNEETTNWLLDETAKQSPNEEEQIVTDIFNGNNN
jgi:hypothetical protein